MSALRRGRALGLAALLSMGLLGAGSAQQQPPKKTKPAAASPSRAASGGSASTASPYAQRFAQVCAACHGANGSSDMPGVPLLAGQPSFYVATQLYLFREGRRGNEAMTAVGKTLTDADLRGYSDFVGTLPPVPTPPPATPPDPARMKKGQELAQQHKCFFCHGPNLDGGQQVPRIAGQKEDYLQAALQGFKSHTRPGYTMAMPEAVSQISPADLDTLAYFAARFSPPPAK